MAEENWELSLTSRAESDLDDLLEEQGDDGLDEVLGEILALKEEPVPEDAQPLRGTKDYYRIYVYRGRYRAIYRLLRGKRTVLIERIGPRGSVYRGFDRW